MSFMNRSRQMIAGSEVVRTSLSSALIVLVRVGGTAITFLYTLLIARTMSPHDVGVVWAIWSASFIVSTFATMNFGAAAVREIVRARTTGNDDLAAGFVIASRYVLLSASLPVMAGFLLFYRLHEPDAFQTYFWAYLIAAVSLPVMGWVQINASQAAALNRALYSQAPRELLRPLVFLIAFGAALALGLAPTVEFAVGTYLVAVLLTALVQYLLLRDAFGFMRTARPDTREWKHWFTSGLLLTPSRIMGEHLKNLLIVAGAAGLAPADTGRFAVALSLITFLNFGISAVDMTFSPRISGAMAAGKPGRRDMLLAASCGLKVVPVVVAALLLAVLAEPILSIFGPAYVEAEGAIFWFLLMPLSKAVFGPNDLVLQVHGARRAIFVCALAAIAGIGIAIPLVGAEYGLTAGAAAGSIAYAMAQLVLWIACLKTTKVDTSVFGAIATLARRLRARENSQGEGSGGARP